MTEPTRQAADFALTVEEREALYPIVRKSVGAYMVIERIIAARLARARAEALREAGAKIAQTRNGATGRRMTNAEYFGYAVHSMGDEIEYQAERAMRKSLDQPTPGGAA